MKWQKRVKKKLKSKQDRQKIEEAKKDAYFSNSLARKLYGKLPEAIWIDEKHLMDQNESFDTFYQLQKELYAEGVYEMECTMHQIQPNPNDMLEAYNHKAVYLERARMSGGGSRICVEAPGIFNQVMQNSDIEGPQRENRSHQNNIIDQLRNNTLQCAVSDRVYSELERNEPLSEDFSLMTLGKSEIDISEGKLVIPSISGTLKPAERIFVDPSLYLNGEIPENILVDNEHGEARHYKWEDIDNPNLRPYRYNGTFYALSDPTGIDLRVRSIDFNSFSENKIPSNNYSIKSIKKQVMGLHVQYEQQDQLLEQYTQYFPHYENYLKETGADLIESISQLQKTSGREVIKYGHFCPICNKETIFRCIFANDSRRNGFDAYYLQFPIVKTCEECMKGLNARKCCKNCLDKECNKPEFNAMSYEFKECCEIGVNISAKYQCPLCFRSDKLEYDEDYRINWYCHHCYKSFEESELLVKQESKKILL